MKPSGVAHAVRVGLAVTMCCAALLAASVAPAQRNVAPEHELKAAYVYNFLKFIEWPAPVVARLDGKLTVCVLGSHPVGDALTAASESKVGDLELVIETLQDVGRLERCQALFIPASSSRSAEICESARGKGILTVTDFDDRDAEVGIINLWRRSGRVVFSVDLETARNEGLRISSRLLEVAVERSEIPDGLR